MYVYMNEAGSVNEIWKPIEDFPLYEVSNLGRVRSFRQRKAGKILLPYLAVYKTVWLFKDKKRKAKYLHRLIAESFLPRIDGKPFINHRDGNKYNNHLDNLEWCTSKENLDHSVRILGNKNHSLGYQYGADNYMSKITEWEVIAIKAIKAATPSITGVRLARMFNLNPPQISNILTGKSWKHIAFDF